MTASGRVIVVGGGITGLVTAYRLTRTGNGDSPPEVIVLESAERAGGKLWTIQLDGMSVEAGADSFVVRKPWALDLCRELGLGDELVRPSSAGASVWTGSRLVSLPRHAAFGIPGSVRDLLTWPGLTSRGRLRGLGDLYRRPSRGDGDQSLGSLIERRLGPEALHVLVGPLLSGIHAGDPRRLSLLATFPELRAWERGHESLLRGARRALKAARSSGSGETPLFASLSGGLSDLVATLERMVGAERVWLGTPVAGIDHDGERFAVHTEGEGAPLASEAVVLASPAFAAASLLRALNPTAAGLLDAIPYASTAAVFLAYPGERLPEGTGFVVPIGTRTITACTYVSRKWPRGDMGDRAVVRCFVGRAGDEEALRLPDRELSAAVAAEVRQATGLSGPPSLSRVVRWARSMPQYEVGHLERVAAIERALERTPGLFLAGAAYRGVGIADCVRQANQAAESARAYLRATAGDRRVDGGTEAMRWTR